MKVLLGYAGCLCGWLILFLELPEWTEKPAKWLTFGRHINGWLQQATDWAHAHLPEVPSHLLTDSYWATTKLLFLWPQLSLGASLMLAMLASSVAFMLLMPRSEQLKVANRRMSILFEGFFLLTSAVLVLFPKAFVYLSTLPSGLSIFEFLREPYGLSLARSVNPSRLLYEANIYMSAAIVSYQLLAIVSLIAWRKYQQQRQREEALDELLKR